MSSHAFPLDRPALTWSDALLLGHEKMDATHQEFVDRVSTLLASSDEDFAQNLGIFLQHAEEHFGQEDRWMVETQFPSAGCHIDEHAAVLRSVREVQAFIEENTLEVGMRAGRGLANELARWFPGHTDHLDSALSHWLCMRQSGGRPVVIRRNVGRQSP